MARPIIGRLRRKAVDAATAIAERHSFSAEIPGSSPDRPAWRLRIEMVSEAQGDGEHLRLRAHLQSHLSEMLEPMPSRKADQSALVHDSAEPSLAASSQLAPVYRLAARGLRTALAVPALRRLAEPLLRQDFESWIELRASTADLADGAAALLPEIDKLKAYGIEAPAGDGPLIRTWAGPASSGARPGLAQVSLLRFDRRHLPEAVAALLGGRPFSLAGAIVNVVEETKKPPRRN